jgi:hypothetical protein
MGGGHKVPLEAGDLMTMLWGLRGEQANDAGWQRFSSKYVTYPRFRKEWWAYRRPTSQMSGTGHTLKEKCLTPGTKSMVGDMEDLGEV